MIVDQVCFNTGELLWKTFQSPPPPAQNVTRELGGEGRGGEGRGGDITAELNAIRKQCVGYAVVELLHKCLMSTTFLSYHN